MSDIIAGDVCMDLPDAWILHPDVRDKGNQKVACRDQQARLDEAIGLANAIHLNIAGADIVPVRQVQAGTFLGKGKVEEYVTQFSECNIKLVIIDASLSPIQQRNLEEAWKCKVIDRTALILEIFGERAQTGEGVLQVELAALEYQKSRLVRSWTHLERQRGGHGSMGGPGEKQIESDRRAINDRITKIRRQLQTVMRTRALHRKSRKKVPYPIVALVGYTNAGKSTLFNRLTGADVVAEDALFATLDPTMRMVTLPSGRKVIFSDTVGFISDLPTELIAAFRATLEEVVEADLILHVRDIASAESREQKEDVLLVLEDLEVSDKLDDSGIEVLNKIDLLDVAPGEGAEEKTGISALTGMGCDALLQRIDAFFAKSQHPIDVLLQPDQGQLLAWLHNYGEEVSVVPEGENGALRVAALLSDKYYAQFQKKLA